jgi:hypothetical protein
MDNSEKARTTLSEYHEYLSARALERIRKKTLRPFKHLKVITSLSRKKQEHELRVAIGKDLETLVI